MESNKREIIWNIVNSLLAGVLVFLGACADGNVTLRALVTAGIAALVIAITKFKSYWATQEGEYSYTERLFTFIG